MLFRSGNLNKYEFLITLLHELAHLLCFEQYKNSVEAHGKQWKQIYAQLLVQFIQLQIFPEDVQKSLEKTLINPAATASGETALLTVLRKYNQNRKEGVVMLSAVKEGALFKEIKGRVFRKIKLRRKRIECLEIATGNVYLFSALTEVEPIF